MYLILEICPHKGEHVYYNLIKTLKKFKKWYY